MQYENHVAKNVYEYMKRPESGSHGSVWNAQAYLLLNLLGEICWNCSSGHRDLSEFAFTAIKASSFDLSKTFALMEHGKCPHCGATRHAMAITGRYPIPYIANLVLGQRSGKGVLWSVLVHYYEHRLKAWHDAGLLGKLPHEFKLAGIQIEATNAGCSGYAVDMLRRGTREFDDLLESRGESVTRLVRHGNSWAWKSVSNDYYSKTPLLLRVVDEAAWMLGLADITPAAVIQHISTYGASNPLQRRLDVLAAMQDVPDLLPMLSVFTTSPMAKGDLADVLGSAAVIDSGVFHVKLPTWAFNPLLKIEDFKEEFERSPAATWRDFGCSLLIPPAKV